jgi:hypothetical protein
MFSAVKPQMSAWETKVTGEQACGVRGVDLKFDHDGPGPSWFARNNYPSQIALRSICLGG